MEQVKIHSLYRIMEDVVSKLIFLFQDIPEMPERRMTDSIGEVFIKFELTFIIVSQQK